MRPLQGQYTLSIFFYGKAFKNIRQGLAKVPPDFLTPRLRRWNRTKIQGFLRSHRLTVRTSGFHPGNRSSILRGITSTKRKMPLLKKWHFAF